MPTPSVFQFVFERFVEDAAVTYPRFRASLIAGGGKLHHAFEDGSDCAGRWVSVFRYSSSMRCCRKTGSSVFCALTFELSGRRRQDARPGPVKMYGVPPARAWWPAVGAPLERGVRHPCAPLARGVILHARDCASLVAQPQEQSRYSASAALVENLAWRSAPCSERHSLA